MIFSDDTNTNTVENISNWLISLTSKSSSVDGHDGYNLQFGRTWWIDLVCLQDGVYAYRIDSATDCTAWQVGSIDDAAGSIQDCCK